MIDIKSFIKVQKAMWVKRLATPDKASWKAVPMLYLSSLLGPDTFKCNMSCSIKPEGFPEFYWQILQNWFELKSLTMKGKTILEIRQESLWLNKEIKCDKQELNCSTWVAGGIKYIQDIVNNQSNFITKN